MIENRSTIVQKSISKLSNIDQQLSKIDQNWIPGAALGGQKAGVGLQEAACRGQEGSGSAQGGPGLPIWRSIGAKWPQHEDILGPNWAQVAFMLVHVEPKLVQSGFQ